MCAHLKNGRGALNLACEDGYFQLVMTLLGEFGMSLDNRDNVTSVSCHMFGTEQVYVHIRRVLFEVGSGALHLACASSKLYC